MIDPAVRRPQKLAQAAAWHRAHGHDHDAYRIEQLLVAYGRCKRCGRTLTDLQSLERGIGPECVRKT